MEFIKFKSCVAAIPFGKRLPTALYVFRSDTVAFGDPLDSLLANLVKRYEISAIFNIVKFRTDELKISFLSYPGFLMEAHPALEYAVAIDLVTGKCRRTDYANNLNPPILHRKETFLPTSHARWKTFRALTVAEEEAGLYRDTSTIGFKMNWERLLSAKGLIIDGHTLSTARICRENSVSAVPLIRRHKTAITRYELSKPVKSLLEYAILKPGASFFDYGCGQGSDIRGLQELGFESDGWDPVFRPGAQKRDADVVNLGYVLNVIEDPAERLGTLVEAYRQSKRLLVVSALINETVEAGRAARFRDGVLTRRNTFQKYFDQQELHQYIEDALDTSAVPVALGVFYIFRDPAEQQDFLSTRSRRVIDWTQIKARLGLGKPSTGRWQALYEENKGILDIFGHFILKLGRFPQCGEYDRELAVVEKLGSMKRGLKAFVLGGGANELDWSEVAQRFGIGQPRKAHWEVLYEQRQELLDTFWMQTLQLGRPPTEGEFPRFAEVRETIGSPKKAIRLLLRRGGGEALRQAAENRRKDLLVYVALANLRKQVPFGHLSPRLRLDVKTFFGSYKDALAKGLELLYAAGDSGEIELACEDLPLGWQDEQALYIHRELLQQLPPVLHAYVGCAVALFGDVAQADIIKLHKGSGKVTFLIYDDFAKQSLPELRQRIKVNLRTRWVQVFDHSADGQLLYSKERFVSPNHPHISGMRNFSAKLRNLGILSEEGNGPTKPALIGLLAKQGLNENLRKKRSS